MGRVLLFVLVVGLGLLMTLAVVSTLAAIALPNMLEAQTSHVVSRPVYTQVATGVQAVVSEVPDWGAGVGLVVFLLILFGMALAAGGAILVRRCFRPQEADTELNLELEGMLSGLNRLEERTAALEELLVERQP